MNSLILAGMPAALGFLLLRLLTNPCRRHLLFQFFVGMGCGIGLCSESYFLSRMIGWPPVAPELILLCALGAGLLLKQRTNHCCLCEARAGLPPGSGRITPLVWIFGILVALELALFFSVHMRQPDGGWDAWAIWNLRARFLFRTGGTEWRRAFTDVLAWSHPDYPLLVPAFVARGWTLSGAESMQLPTMVACFFTFATAGLMVTSVGILRGVKQGLLAGIAFAATPFFFVQGAMLCSDVPVAFFRLATLAALAVSDRVNSRGMAALAGIAAALDAWTKNEGLLWLLAFFVARMIVSRRLFMAIVAGALPIMAPVLLFKMHAAGASDIFGGHDRLAMIARTLDPARYSLIGSEMLRHVWEFGPLLPGAFVLLAFYRLFAGSHGNRADRPAIRTGALALALTTSGYVAIYLVHPLNLQWLLDTSSDRLLLQLWPAVVFVAFLSARSSAQESTAPSTPRHVMQPADLALPLPVL